MTPLPTPRHSTAPEPGTAQPAAPEPFPFGPRAVAAAGCLALAVAMGIGRFAFTPLLPMMLHEGALDLAGASALATDNYLGYWLGAIACTLQPMLWARQPRLKPWRTVQALRAGLVATIVLTAGMAFPWPWAWPWLRFGAGLASALVLVCTSGWCLTRLTEQGAPALAGFIFMGPGLGIAVSGVAATAMLAHAWSSAAGWSVFALLAVLLTGLAWPVFRSEVATPVAAATGPRGAPRAVLAWVTLAYGLAGFGYIVSATFLPVIARSALPGSVWLDLFWPLFGLGVALGAGLTVRLPPRWNRPALLAACYAMQATGVLLTVAWPSLAGFALGSALLGLPFTAITLFTLQEVRRLHPQAASVVIGLVTAAYGLGQIAGPPMVAALMALGVGPGRGFALSLQVAAAALAVGGVGYAMLARRRPEAQARQGGGP